MQRTKQSIVEASACFYDAIDRIRCQAANETNQHERKQRGQYFTPSTTASFLASMCVSEKETVRILDPGSGSGILTAALIHELCNRNSPPRLISAALYESDPALIPYIRKTMAICRRLCKLMDISLHVSIICGDFITESTIQRTDTKTSSNFDIVITNPPYFKLNSQSPTRSHLKQAGLDTNNMYAAFILISQLHLVDGGELIAITPRSFCNGRYFKNFRRQLLNEMAISRIHVFKARDKVFRDSGVLQENIVFHAVKSHERAPHICISASDGLTLETLPHFQAKFDEIIRQEGDDSILYVISSELDRRSLRKAQKYVTSLDDLGIHVSTGRIVDFRVKDALSYELKEASCPLIYPCHIETGRIDWPDFSSNKPNWLKLTNATLPHIVPSGYYVAVKRFTAKGDQRRLIAAVVDPSIAASDSVAFENHVNFYHCNGKSMNPDLARGLTYFLNSNAMNGLFELFSGSTQINVDDLRRIRYPSMSHLIELGKRMERLSRRNPSVIPSVERNETHEEYYAS